MSFYYKMKMKLQRFAVPNLPVIATAVFAAGYLLSISGAGLALFLNVLSFDPEAVLHGQIWRILTGLLFSPFTGKSLFQALLGLYIYYNFADIVERSMGTFEFNLYFFSSYLIGYLAVLAVYLIGKVSMIYLPYYAQFSVFIAFAVMYPNLQVLLFFLIPIRAWIIALGELIFYIADFIRGGIYIRTLIGAALVHAALFYLIVNRSRGNTMSLFRYLKERKRQQEWQRKYNNRG